jgi:hypothetical protein
MTVQLPPPILHCVRCCNRALFSHILGVVLIHCQPMGCRVAFLCPSGSSFRCIKEHYDEKEQQCARPWLLGLVDWRRWRRWRREPQLENTARLTSVCGRLIPQPAAFPFGKGSPSDLPRRLIERQSIIAIRNADAWPIAIVPTPQRNAFTERVLGRWINDAVEALSESIANCPLGRIISLHGR